MNKKSVNLKINKRISEK
ncbi:hypothetical protein BAPKO_2535 (plasmid) [Borreliella afzelii PKo]|nr:hypothetical protein BAPKO_2535 [Borreliella afzelii PKo]